MLNPTYFEEVSSQTIGEAVYSGVRPLDHPMILFSEVDGQPLAALHLKSRGKGKGVIAQRNIDVGGQRFQGLLTEDNQEFELIISNLSHAFVNFNILKTDDNVKEVMPSGLNEINELRPGESYRVQCDQENNMSLILSTIKDKKTGKKVSVEKDESTSEKKIGSIGTYYFLSVFPQINDKKICDQFKKTTWKCVDYFVRKTNVPKPTFRTHITPGSMDGRFEDAMQPSYSDSSDFDDDTEGFDEPVYRSFEGFNEQLCFAKEEDLEESEESEDMGLDGLFGDRPPPQPQLKNVSVSEDLIEKSAASTVKQGNKVEVFSQVSHIEYNYDLPSIQCIIGLSVSDKLIFRKNKNNIREDVKELIKKYITDEYKDFINEKTYKSDSCCICLEDKPNVIFYQCGHKCIHMDCMGDKLDKCPLCRRYITASLPS